MIKKNIEQIKIKLKYLKKISKNIFIFFFITFLLIKSANSESLYIFGSSGYTNHQISSKDTDEINNKLTKLGFATASTSYNSDNLSYKVGAGIRTPFNMFVEGSYVNYGKISFSSSTTSPSESLLADVEIKGLSLDLLKNIGFIGFSAGVVKVDDTVTISTSRGNADVPIDSYILPRIGVDLKFNSYRLELDRIYVTPNSNINSIMLGYIFNVF